MESRIDRIDAFVAKRDAEIAKENREKEERLKELLDTVRSWSTRLRNLLELGVYMYHNDVPLGPYDTNEPGFKDYNIRMFVSNGLSHRVGFIIAYRIDGHIPSKDQRFPIGFGIIGGGCDGEDICFNADGELEWLNKPFGNPAGVSGRPWNNKDMEHLEKFVQDFPKFEKEFYEYVDNL